MVVYSITAYRTCLVQIGLFSYYEACLTTAMSEGDWTARGGSYAGLLGRRHERFRADRGHPSLYGVTPVNIFESLWGGFVFVFHEDKVSSSRGR